MEKESVNRRLFPLETLSDLEVLRIARDKLLRDYVRRGALLRNEPDADKVIVRVRREANRQISSQIAELQALIESLEAEDRKER